MSAKKIMAKERYLWISIIVFVLLLQFIPFCSSLGNSSDEEKEDTYFNLMREAVEYVRTHYVDQDKISYKNLVHGAIKGMLKSLKDDHTSFLSEEDFADLNTQLKNQFGGLGIFIGVKDEYPTVISPIDDTPADRVGMKPGDKIVDIEGTSTKGMEINEVVKRLKGKPGTKVSIKVSRESALELIPLSITRALINVPTVKYGLIKKNLGYIRIVTFGDKTAPALKEALRDLSRKGMRQLVLDLRNNPGGLLKSAVDVCNMFIDEGKLVYTVGRHPRQTENYYASESKTRLPKSIPIIVLVNEGSASASEIVAGAIQDTRRGIVVGTKSYGKGSVQVIVPLKSSGEQVGMRLTIQKYKTPAGRSIHGKGIEPDVLVKLPKIKFEDVYMQKKLQDGKYIESFVNKYPNYTNAQVSSLLRTLKSHGITLNRRIVDRQIRDYKHRASKPPLFDLEYDIQLKKAVELIRTSKKLKRTVKVFK